MYRLELHIHGTQDGLLGLEAVGGGQLRKVPVNVAHGHSARELLRAGAPALEHGEGALGEVARPAAAPLARPLVLDQVAGVLRARRQAEHRDVELRQELLLDVVVWPRGIAVRQNQAHQREHGLRVAAVARPQLVHEGGPVPAVFRGAQPLEAVGHHGEGQALAQARAGARAGGRHLASCSRGRLDGLDRV